MSILQNKLVRQLFKELDDAVSFMETFEKDGDEHFKQRIKRKADLLNDIDEIDSDYEFCDKCGKALSKIKGEDIYLELIDVILCGPCHSEHKGVEKYWSEYSLEEYRKNQTVSEWCPHCENEVELERKFEKQFCPSCGV